MIRLDSRMIVLLQILTVDGVRQAASSSSSQAESFRAGASRATCRNSESIRLFGSDVGPSNPYHSPNDHL